MDKEKKYEQMYDILANYENKIHENNQRRIKIGLRCIWIIPLIFLILLFWTDSSKIIFLILWIVSLFGIACYLILVEYADYKLQEKLKEIKLDDSDETKELISVDLDNVTGAIKSVVEKIDDSLNSDLETSVAEKEVMEDEEHI